MLAEMECSYTVVLPDHMRHETDEGAADYWRAQAVQYGWIPTGDPEVKRESLKIRWPDGGLSDLFPGVEVVVRVEGPVVASGSMAPLPKAKPDWPTVEAAAAALAAKTSGAHEWDDLPDGVQTYYARLVEDLLVAAMPHLTALILEHVVENPNGFMLTPEEQDALADVAELARAEVNPYGI